MLDPADFQNEIYRAARQAANNYGGKFDVDDIAQAISVDMIENHSRYGSIKGNLFFEILKRSGIRYCAEECARYLTFSEQYIYSSEELKRLLVTFYKPESWPNGLKQPVVEHYETVEEFRDELEEWNNATQLVIDMIDVEYAIDKLSEAQRKVIEKKYRDLEKLESKYQMNKHSEAIRYLTSHINTRMVDRAKGPRGHEGPGARSVVTNAHAIAVTANQFTNESPIRDSVDTTQWHQQQAYPSNRYSKHVVNSPWRDSV